jgi:filamentous hemagglutinin family protein
MRVQPGILGVGLSFAAISVLLLPIAGLAQSITIDGTLAPARTLIGPNYNIQQVDGAAIGANLFHSFGRFNLVTGETASFESAANIRNIIARVTGGAASTIDGLLFTQSRNVNLFLLNPAGIIFGQNARLNIGGVDRGSVIATTLDAITFPGGGQFSAVNPGGHPSLLTLVGDPSGFLGSQRQPGSLISNARFLSTYPGQSILFVGGTVQLNNSELASANGRIELAGIGAGGVVGLKATGTQLALDIPVQTQRADVAIVDRSLLAVMDRGAGSVAVTARNLDIAGGSGILAGIVPGQTASSDRPGAITLDVANRFTLRQDSALGNSVFNDAVGNGGNIQIQAGSLHVTTGSFIANFHQGVGKGGNVLITARDSVTFIGGEEPASVTTFAFGGEGDTGDIRVTANQLNLLNGSSLQTAINRPGNAGQILLNIQDAIVLDGTARNPLLSSTISSDVFFDGVGRGGNIQLTTGSLSITNGAVIESSITGQGNGGDITIIARDTVRLDGAVRNPFGIRSSSINSAVFEAGSGGTIRITTRDLTISNGAGIDVSLSTLGRGNTGNIFINASESIRVDGEAPEQLTTASGRLLSFSSKIDALVGTGAIGNGGIVQLQTRDLSLTNGGSISTTLAGQGNAANVNVFAQDRILISGTSKDGGRSGIFSGVNQGEDFRGEFFQGVGRGGTIRLATGDLLLDQEGIISTNAISELGITGDIAVQANTVQLDNASRIVTVSAIGDGGNITLNARDFISMRRNSLISASSSFDSAPQGSGAGGNITINVPNGFLVSAPNENNDIIANAFGGNGGRVAIAAQGVYWFTPRSRAELVRLLGTDDPAQLTPRNLPTNDITAISQGSPNLSGIVVLTTPDVDPSRGLTQLTGTLVDPTQQVDQRCAERAGSPTSSFVASGRGGLPPTPTAPIQTEETVTDWVTVDRPPTDGRNSDVRNSTAGSSGATSNRRDSSRQNSNQPAHLIEAQGWIQQADGTTFLVALAPRTEPHPLERGLTGCSATLKQE